MKIGDKVRFLSEVGGGKISGFQGKDIVMVMDEDGFEIPTSIHDVVVVEQDDYAMGKMISAKMDAKQAAEERSNTELKNDSRSIKSILNQHDVEVDMNVDEYDAADREITPRLQPVSVTAATSSALISLSCRWISRKSRIPVSRLTSSTTATILSNIPILWLRVMP